MPKLDKSKLGRPIATSNPPGSLVGQVGEARPITVTVEELTANPYQPRIIFEDTDLTELADSIAANGMLQRIGIAVMEETGATHIVYGERRWRATKILGRSTIDAIDYGERPAIWFIQQAYNENAKRKDFKLVERIRAYQSLLEQMREVAGGGRVTQRMLAEKMGESETNVGKYLKIGEHQELLQELERLARQGKDGSLTEYHDRAVAIEGTRRKPAEAVQPPAAANAKAAQAGSNGYGPLTNEEELDYDNLGQPSRRPKSASGSSRSKDERTARSTSVAQLDDHRTTRPPAGTIPIRGEYTDLGEATELLLGIEQYLLSEKAGNLPIVAASYDTKEFVAAARRLYIAAAGRFGEREG